jgi:hypothetical protein
MQLVDFDLPKSKTSERMLFFGHGFAEEERNRLRTHFSEVTGSGCVKLLPVDEEWTR